MANNFWREMVAEQWKLPRSLEAPEAAADDDDDDEDAGGSSVMSCKLYSFRTSWTAANSFSPKFWSLWICEEHMWMKSFVSRTRLIC